MHIPPPSSRWFADIQAFTLVVAGSTNITPVSTPTMVLVPKSWLVFLIVDVHTLPQTLIWEPGCAADPLGLHFIGQGQHFFVLSSLMQPSIAFRHRFMLVHTWCPMQPVLHYFLAQNAAHKCAYMSINFHSYILNLSWPDQRRKLVHHASTTGRSNTSWIYAITRPYQQIQTNFCQPTPEPT
jgi:hypothetical protein